MKFDELEEKMRIYEQSLDYCVPPGMFIVARLDGRGFTRLTREIHKFKAPYDEGFRDMMVATTEHLMNCGFRVIYGYTQSDEISLLFHLEEDAFGRKERKYDSILAAEASSNFALLLGAHAAFDCRISQLPKAELVRDYFRWRNEDAHRNALNGYCYWTLRNNGIPVAAATKRLEGMSVAEKNELLFQFGFNFNEAPKWQKRGIGLYWEPYEVSAINQLTGEEAIARRRRIKVDYNLPMKDQYGAFILGLIEESVEGQSSHELHSRRSA